MHKAVGEKDGDREREREREIARRRGREERRVADGERVKLGGKGV